MPNRNKLKENNDFIYSFSVSINIHLRRHCRQSRTGLLSFRPVPWSILPHPNLPPSLPDYQFTVKPSTPTTDMPKSSNKTMMWATMDTITHIKQKMALLSKKLAALILELLMKAPKPEAFTSMWEMMALNIGLIIPLTRMVSSPSERIYVKPRQIVRYEIFACNHKRTYKYNNKDESKYLFKTVIFI